MGGVHGVLVFSRERAYLLITASNIKILFDDVLLQKVLPGVGFEQNFKIR